MTIIPAPVFHTAPTIYNGHTTKRIHTMEAAENCPVITDAFQIILAPVFYTAPAVYSGTTVVRFGHKDEAMSRIGAKK